MNNALSRRAMQVKISQWGGSAAIRIPRMAAETLGLHRGEKVDLRIEGDTLVLERSSPSYDLKELIIEAKNCEQPEVHDELALGQELL